MRFYSTSNFSCGKSPINADVELLLCAIKAAIYPDERVDFVAKAKSICDWSKLISSASLQGLLPTLSCILTKDHFSYIPQAHFDKLHESKLNNALRGLKLTTELDSLLKNFATEGIRALPIKGETLAMLAYGDICWRETGDIDLLVNPAQVLQTYRILTQRGYKTSIDLSDPRNAQYVSLMYELPFYHSLTNYQVDIHWALTPATLPSGLDFEELCEHLVETRPGGKTVKTFAPEELLFYLCLHSAKHCWERISWLGDIGGLIHRHPQLDWERVLQLAHRHHNERILLSSLWLVHQTLDIALPAQVLQLIAQDPAIPKIADDILAQFHKEQQPLRKPLAFYLYFLRFKKGSKAKAEYLVRALFTPTVNDWLYWRFPAKLGFLYPFLRPVKWALQKLNIKSTQTIT